MMTNSAHGDLTLPLTPYHIAMQAVDASGIYTSIDDIDELLAYAAVIYATLSDATERAAHAMCVARQVRELQDHPRRRLAGNQA